MDSTAQLPPRRRGRPSGARGDDRPQDGSRRRPARSATDRSGSAVALSWVGSYIPCTQEGLRVERPANEINKQSDHFDHRVESSLRRDLPIITTPHGKSQLTGKGGPGEAFTDVFALDVFQQMLVDVRKRTAGDDDDTMMRTADSNAGVDRQPRMRVTAMPGTHVPGRILQTLNELARAVYISFYPDIQLLPGN